ncbi:putative piezo-type mechanosensitive ion channel component 1/2 [Blattamonas nauphoetae]|uniref:Piezo-type mechanosensitive ion channel component 1/2 n=1 Tax=Blattamonas nauphoetae TaxID=2049346 RepID=A0ABQ9YHX4_9EUKA|nr:putative piezo-type mechanosensitive ion channel component 1/2 [Blattamonas nauphoetae]
MFLTFKEKMVERVITIISLVVVLTRLIFQIFQQFIFSSEIRYLIVLAFGNKEKFTVGQNVGWIVWMVILLLLTLLQLIAGFLTSTRKKSNHTTSLQSLFREEQSETTSYTTESSVAQTLTKSEAFLTFRQIIIVSLSPAISVAQIILLNIAAIPSSSLCFLPLLFVVLIVAISFSTLPLHAKGYGWENDSETLGRTIHPLIKRIFPFHKKTSRLDTKVPYILLVCVLALSSIVPPEPRSHPDFFSKMFSSLRLSSRQTIFSSKSFVPLLSYLSLFLTIFTAITQPPALQFLIPVLVVLSFVRSPRIILVGLRVVSSIFLLVLVFLQAVNSLELSVKLSFYDCGSMIFAHSFKSTKSFSIGSLWAIGALSFVYFRSQRPPTVEIYPTLSPYTANKPGRQPSARALRLRLRLYEFAKIFPKASKAAIKLLSILLVMIHLMTVPISYFSLLTFPIILFPFLPDTVITAISSVLFPLFSLIAWYCSSSTLCFPPSPSKPTFWATFIEYYLKSINFIFNTGKNPKITSALDIPKFHNDTIAFSAFSFMIPLGITLAMIRWRLSRPTKPSSLSARRSDGYIVQESFSESTHNLNAESPEQYTRVVDQQDPLLPTKPKPRVLTIRKNRPASTSVPDPEPSQSDYQPAQLTQTPAEEPQLAEEALEQPGTAIDTTRDNHSEEEPQPTPHVHEHVMHEPVPEARPDTPVNQTVTEPPSFPHSSPLFSVAIWLHELSRLFTFVVTLLPIGNYMNQSLLMIPLLWSLLFLTRPLSYKSKRTVGVHLCMIIFVFLFALVAYTANTGLFLILELDDHSQLHVQIAYILGLIKRPIEGVLPPVGVQMVVSPFLIIFGHSMMLILHQSSMHHSDLVRKGAPLFESLARSASFNNNVPVIKAHTEFFEPFFSQFCWRYRPLSVVPFLVAHAGRLIFPFLLCVAFSMVEVSGVAYFVIAMVYLFSGHPHSSSATVYKRLPQVATVFSWILLIAVHVLAHLAYLHANRRIHLSEMTVFILNLLDSLGFTNLTDYRSVDDVRFERMCLWSHLLVLTGVYIIKRTSVVFDIVNTHDSTLLDYRRIWKSRRESDTIRRMEQKRKKELLATTSPQHFALSQTLKLVYQHNTFVEGHSPLSSSTATPSDTGIGSGGHLPGTNPVLSISGSDSSPSQIIDPLDTVQQRMTDVLPMNLVNATKPDFSVLSKGADQFVGVFNVLINWVSMYSVEMNIAFLFFCSYTKSVLAFVNLGLALILCVLVFRRTLLLSHKSIRLWNTYIIILLVEIGLLLMTGIFHILATELCSKSTSQLCTTISTLSIFLKELFGLSEFTTMLSCLVPLIISILSRSLTTGTKTTNQSKEKIDMLSVLSENQRSVPELIDPSILAASNTLSPSLVDEFVLQFPTTTHNTIGIFSDWSLPSLKEFCKTVKMNDTVCQSIPLQANSPSNTLTVHPPQLTDGSNQTQTVDTTEEVANKKKKERKYSIDDLHPFDFSQFSIPILRFNSYALARLLLPLILIILFPFLPYGIATCLLYSLLLLCLLFGDTILLHPILVNIFTILTLLSVMLTPFCHALLGTLKACKVDILWLTQALHAFLLVYGSSAKYEITPEGSIIYGVPRSAQLFTFFVLLFVLIYCRTLQRIPTVSLGRMIVERRDKALVGQFSVQSYLREKVKKRREVANKFEEQMKPIETAVLEHFDWEEFEVKDEYERYNTLLKRKKQTKARTDTSTSKSRISISSQQDDASEDPIVFRHDSDPTPAPSMSGSALPKSDGSQTDRFVEKMAIISKQQMSDFMTEWDDRMIEEEIALEDAFIMNGYKLPKKEGLSEKFRKKMIELGHWFITPHSHHLVETEEFTVPGNHGAVVTNQFGFSSASPGMGSITEASSIHSESDVPASAAENSRLTSKQKVKAVISNLFWLCILHKEWLIVICTISLFQRWGFMLIPFFLVHICLYSTSVYYPNKKFWNISCITYASCFVLSINLNLIGQDGLDKSVFHIFKYFLTTFIVLFIYHFLMEFSGLSDINPRQAFDVIYSDKPISVIIPPFHTVQANRIANQNSSVTFREYLRIAMSSEKDGTSYHIVKLLIEVVSLLVLVLSQNMFVAESLAEEKRTFLDLLETGFVGPVILLILFHLLKLCFERASFVSGNIPLRYVVLLIETTIICVFGFFYAFGKHDAPASNPPFSFNLYLVLQIFSSFITSLQISEGYPHSATSHVVAQPQKHDLIHYFAAIVTNKIPLLYEFCIVIDWAVQKTSLTMFEFARLEDMYQRLYEERGEFNWDEDTRKEKIRDVFLRRLEKRGRKMRKIYKKKQEELQRLIDNGEAMASEFDLLQEQFESGELEREILLEMLEQKNHDLLDVGQLNLKSTDHGQTDVITIDEDTPSLTGSTTPRHLVTPQLSTTPQPSPSLQALPPQKRRKKKEPTVPDEFYLRPTSLFTKEERRALFEETHRKNTVAGIKYSKMMQCLMGLGFILLLVLLVWGPLLLFSNFGIATQPNYVVDAQMQLTSNGLMTIFYSEMLTNERMNKTTLRQTSISNLKLSTQERENVYNLTFPPESSTYCLTTESSFELYKKNVCANKTTWFDVSFQMKRSQHHPNETTVYRSRIILNETSKPRLSEYCSVLQETPNSSLPLTFPVAYYLKSNDQTIELTSSPGKEGSLLTTANLTFNHVGTNLLFGLQHNVSILAVSPPTPLSMLKSVGMIGFYTTYIIVIANSVLRPTFSEYVEQLQFSELTHVNTLFDFAASIFIKRRKGKLRQEETMYRLLIEMMRNPKYLFALTQPDQPRQFEKALLQGEAASSKKKED